MKITPNRNYSIQFSQEELEKIDAWNLDNKLSNGITFNDYIERQCEYGIDIEWVDWEHGTLTLTIDDQLDPENLYDRAISNISMILL